MSPARPRSLPAAGGPQQAADMPTDEVTEPVAMTVDVDALFS
ncbi:hypothetical protein [uncultured Arthrobacter sp.]